MNREKLLVDNATLRAENRYLRKLVGNSKHGRLLRRTHTDAQQLIAWRFAGLSISRRAANEMGMGQRRWQWARALLMLAGVHNGEDVIEPDFDAVLRALHDTSVSLEKTGLDRLRLRLPRFVNAANGAAHVAANGVANHAANFHGQTVTALREKAGRGGAQTGQMRDRRAEIEQRLGVNT
ncbi:MAG: hypothetical protein R3A44_10280 [Caldilineaceae bacterium]